MTNDASRPRGPGMVYLALATVASVLVAVIAYAATQPPPPTIAEFAPQAQKQITDAPDEQEARLGRPGVSPTPEPTATPGPGVRDDERTLPEIVLPRVRQCVGDPPRQIRDPQAPPCVPYWDDDNGGRTSRGVDATTIKVAWPKSIERDEDILALAAFFNSRFEFYGRKIELKIYTVGGGIEGKADPANMTADAKKVADELEAFASLAYVPRAGAERIHYDELARLGVISVDARQTLRDAAHYKKHAPYQWTVEAPYDVMLRNLGEWYCNGLHGRPAAHVGPGMERAPRSLGLVWARAADGTTPDPEPLFRTLRACGTSPAVHREMNERTDDLQEGQQLAVDMKLAGVTSVICICNTGHLGDKLMRSATAQGFFPEWLLTPYQFQDRETSAVEWPANQASQAFGLGFRNKWMEPHEMPWYWAMREAYPGWDPRGPKTRNAGSSGQQGYNMAIVERYGELLLLASGIQMAGPNLTPETFARGLRDAAFPNDRCGGPPYYQACVDYGPNDHAAHDDAAVIWWDPSGENWTTNKPQGGAFCYAERGRRRGIGQWTGPVAVFRPPCR